MNHTSCQIPVSLLNQLPSGSYAGRAIVACKIFRHVRVEADLGIWDRSPRSRSGSLAAWHSWHSFVSRWAIFCLRPTENGLLTSSSRSCRSQIWAARRRSPGQTARTASPSRPDPRQPHLHDHGNVRGEQGTRGMFTDATYLDTSGDKSSTRNFGIDGHTVPASVTANLDLGSLRSGTREALKDSKIERIGHPAALRRRTLQGAARWSTLGFAIRQAAIWQSCRALS